MAQKTIGIIFIFAFSAALAVFLSFARPAYDKDNICQHSADYFLSSNKARMQDVFGVDSREFSATEKLFSWFSDYRLNCDSTSFLFLAKNWPHSYYERNIYIDHPLYNFLAFILIEPMRFFTGNINYPIIFGVFIFVNYALLVASAWFLYSFISSLFSPLIGFASGMFLIFSPFAHSMVAQTTSAGVMELFVVSAGLWLIWHYESALTPRKLIAYSLLFGVLLLGKQVVALSFFTLFLALYYKRYREGLIFLCMHAVPTALWYLYVRLYLTLPYYLVNVSVHDQGVWFLKASYWQGYTMVGIILSALPNFFSNLVYGFLLVPVLFAGYGLHAWVRTKPVIFFLAASLSAAFFALFFAMNLYRPSLSFLLFPVIYPAAAEGIMRISKNRLFFIAIAAFIMIISQLNFHYFIVPGVSW